MSKGLIWLCVFCALMASAYITGCHNGRKACEEEYTTEPDPEPALENLILQSQVDSLQASVDRLTKRSGEYEATANEKTEEAAIIKKKNKQLLRNYNRDAPLILELSDDSAMRYFRHGINKDYSPPGDYILLSDSLRIGQPKLKTSLLRVPTF